MCSEDAKTECVYRKTFLELLPEPVRAQLEAVESLLYQYALQAHPGRFSQGSHLEVGLAAAARDLGAVSSYLQLLAECRASDQLSEADQLLAGAAEVMGDETATMAQRLASLVATPRPAEEPASEGED